MTRRLRHWQAVVDELGLVGNGSGQAYGPCPVHGGDNQSAFSVGTGDDDWPLFMCHSRCEDSQLPSTDPRRQRWYAKVRTILLERHPTLADHLAPAKGHVRGARRSRGALRGAQGNAKPLPDDAQLAKWHERLMSGEDMRAGREFLTERRGLTLDTLVTFQIGWHYKRYTIPVRDLGGDVVNLRSYDPAPPKRRGKMENWPGHGASVLYPIAVLDDFPEDEPVLVVEGELDALIGLQHGLLTLSGTGGAQTPPTNLAPLRGRRVSVAYDCDEAGRVGERKLADRLEGIAGEVRIVHLNDAGVPFGGGDDLTDWFTRHGKSAEDLRRLMKDAPVYDPDDVGPEEAGDLYVTLSTLQPKSVHWLWPGRVPFGKLTIVDGDPGLGKSVLWCDWVARVTTGEGFPGSYRDRREAADAVVVAAEDDLEDTIVPRLIAAGANLNRVHSIPLRRGDDGNLLPLQIPDDLRTLRRAVKATHSAIMVLDPITAYLSESINSHNDASVRRALTPLADAAQKTGAAFVLIRHLNKSGDAKAIYLGGGSIAFSGAARSGLLVERHPEESGVVVLAQAKANLAREVPSLTYEVVSSDEDESVPVVDWLGETDLRADDLLGKRDSRRDSPERDAAVAFLAETLTGNPLSGAIVRQMATEAGHSWTTVKRAKERAGVVTQAVRNEDGQVRFWEWFIPEIVVERTHKEGE